MDPSRLALTVWQNLERFDRQLFELLNGRWTNPFFDWLFPYFRHSMFWAPLYLFLAVFMFLNFGRKGAWWSLIFICTVALTDLIGTRIFKENMERLRPCQDPEMIGHVRLLLKQCSGAFSFVSNHAANHFGLATFGYLTFRSYFRKWMLLAYLWALLIGYAQIYVGVHYPLDVLGGAGLGTLVGYFTARLFNQKWGTFAL